MFRISFFPISYVSHVAMLQEHHAMSPAEYRSSASAAFEHLMEHSSLSSVLYTLLKNISERSIVEYAGAGGAGGARGECKSRGASKREQGSCLYTWLLT